jgi:hypothetical protein
VFPHSVYLLGLGVGSVFTRPFEVYPLDVGPPPATQAKPALGPEEVIAEMIKIGSLFRSTDDGTPPTSPDSQPPTA